MFELEDVLRNGYYKSLLGYNNVDWFVNDVIKLENKMAFYFQVIKKDIIKTGEDKGVYRNENTCRFSGKEHSIDKVRDHCHLTGKYRGPAHNTCKINVTQQHSNIIPFTFHNFSHYDFKMFFKRLVDLKNEEIKFKIFPKTNKDYNSVTYACFRFNDSSSFSSSNLGKLVKN